MLNTKGPVFLLALLCFLLPTSALKAYGHAYSRPNDFTTAQYTDIATDFGIFTVEKCHAANVYGNQSATAKAPFKTNSIAASVGTALKIKSLNASVKVLMYWNAEINFNFYECESEIQPSWIYPDPSGQKRRFYNYSVPAFREWWVRCAIDSVRGSKGALDGLFLDAIPKVAVVHHLNEWGNMMDQIRKALGPGAILLDNGFYGKRQIAGDDAWAHTGFSYVESMSGIGTPADFTPAQGVEFLTWLANASAAYPNRTLVGHGKIVSTPKSAAEETGIEPTFTFTGRNPSFTGIDPTFGFGLAKYLLMTSSSEHGWFLANDGSYSIDGGLLNQPMGVYSPGDGVGCGEPLASFERVGGSSSYKLTRKFEKGSVTVDLAKMAASIDCKN